MGKEWMGAIALVGERPLDGVPENDRGLNLLRLSAAKKTTDFINKLK